MDSKMVLFVTILAACVTVGYSSECCTAYTDPLGTYHASQVCEEYCCWDVPLTKTRTCCSNILLQVPESYRDDCVTWIKEHIWVPIVGTILFLAIVIGICTCCCCCACCRTGSSGVVVRQGFGGPSHTVVVSQQQQQMFPQANPAHTGYVQ